MNELRNILTPVYHGIAMGILALILGALWAAYIATHHESLHGGFESAEMQIKQSHMQAEMNMDSMKMECRTLMPLVHQHLTIMKLQGMVTRQGNNTRIQVV